MLEGWTHFTEFIILAAPCRQNPCDGVVHANSSECEKIGEYKMFVEDYRCHCVEGYQWHRPSCNRRMLSYVLFIENHLILTRSHR